MQKLTKTSVKSAEWEHHKYNVNSPYKDEIKFIKVLEYNAKFNFFNFYHFFALFFNAVQNFIGIP